MAAPTLVSAALEYPGFFDDPQITRIDANRKEFLLDFVKLWECARILAPLLGAWHTSGLKAVRGRSALQKHFMRNPAAIRVHSRVSRADFDWSVCTTFGRFLVMKL